jgi:hypothetical protein
MRIYIYENLHQAYVWCTGSIPAIRYRQPPPGDYMVQKFLLNSTMGSLGAPSLVFGPMGLRLSRVGAELPGVRPLGPEALQVAPTLGFNIGSTQQWAALARRPWCSAPWA